MIDWCATDLAQTLEVPKANVRIVSPYIGGGFGGKLFLRAEALLAALGARMAGRPVKVALQRALVFNNTTHRPATIQRIRIGADSRMERSLPSATRAGRAINRKASRTAPFIRRACSTPGHIA